jgi:endoglucanase
MNHVWFSILRRLAFAAALAAAMSPSLRAQAPATTLVKDTALALDAAGWPAADAAAGVAWAGQGTDRFLSLTSPSPGALVSIPRELVVPAGTDALELSWRQRVSDLKPGPQNGDARLVFEFFDANKTRLAANPPFSFYRENSADWEPKAGRVSVPAGARTFRLTPALVRVESGRYDIDDITVKAVALVEKPAPSQAAASSASAGPTRKAPRTVLPEKGPPPVETERKEYWPPELRVRGNRVVTAAGGQEVWLQGVNVPSLEWSVRGESVQRSIVVAIEDWNANVIRLPVKADHWFGQGTKHNTQKDGGAAYREIIDQAVILAANRGAYLVLDLHHYRAPRPEHLTFWTEAATRYKNHPAVLFDLLNEPHGTSWEVWRDGGFLEEKKKEGDEDAFLTPEEKLHNKRGYQSPGMQKMLDTVRATGARNIAVVGGLDYAYSLTGINEGFALKESANGNGIIYASHIYPWKKGWQKRVLDIAEKHPILLGEVGGDVNKMSFIDAKNQENVDTWVPAMLGLIQQHKLHWTGWCFHPKASPRMLLDWNYTPTPFWGQPAKDALAGKQFPPPDRLR